MRDIGVMTANTRVRLKQCRLTANTLKNHRLIVTSLTSGISLWTAAFMTGTWGVARANDVTFSGPQEVVWKSEPHVQLKTVCVVHTGLTILPGLPKAAVWRLASDPALETRLRPVKKLNGALRSDCGHRGVDILRHHMTVAQETTTPCVVRSVQRTGPHGNWLKDTHCDLPPPTFLGSP